eukprot:448708_1
MSLLFNRKFSRVHKNLRISPRALGVALRVLVDRIRAGKTGYISAPLDQAIDAIHGHLSPDTPYLIDSVGGIISCCGIAGSEKVEQFEKVAYVPRMLVHAMIEYDKDWSLFDASETWIWILKRCVNRVLAQLNSYAAQNNQRRRYSLYDESQPQQPRVPYSQSQQRRPQQPPVPYSQSQQPRRQSQRQCADDDRKCADDDDDRRTAADVWRDLPRHLETMSKIKFTMHGIEQVMEMQGIPDTFRFVIVDRIYHNWLIDGAEWEAEVTDENALAMMAWWCKGIWCVKGHFQQMYKFDNFD